MFFGKSTEELTERLEALFMAEPNAEIDKEIFELATQLVNADADNYKAVYILGQCYHYGISTEVDYAKAVQLYARLSDNQNFNSDDMRYQYKYANVLEKTGDRACFIWYFKASVNGDQWSTYLIASLLLDSNLLPDIDYESRYRLAIDYLNKAIAMNNDEKVTNLAFDLKNLCEAKHQIKDYEIQSQNTIFDLLFNNR